MGLVAGVDGQLEGKAIVDVDVDEDPLLALLADFLALDLVRKSLSVENGGHRLDAVGKDVQIDVGTAANVAREGAADQAGPECPQQPHHAEGLQTHVAEVFRPPLALLELRPDLDLLADLAIAGQVAGLEIAAA